MMNSGPAPSREQLLLIRGTHWSHGISPARLQGVITGFQNWVEEISQSGVLRGSQPLMEQGKLISGPGGTVVDDGAFAGSEDAIAGYFLLAAGSMDEAVKIAQACPILGHGARIEVRPVMNAAFPEGRAGEAAVC